MSRTANTLRNHYDPPRDVPQYEQRVRMERRYNRLVVDRLMVEGAMRHEGETRPTVDRSRVESVSGAEVRGSARWKSSRRVASECVSVTIPGSRFMSDGFRRLVATERFMRGEGVVFSPSRDDKTRRKSATRDGIGAAQSYAARLALVGATGDQS